MGYTHYWYTPKSLGTTAQLKSFTNDCEKIFNYCQNELGIALGNGMGKGSPVIEADHISFNGNDKQPIGVWTTTDNISIPWPSATASLTPELADPCADKTDGSWFAGDLVSQRVAPIDNKTGYGEGSYETCYIGLNHDETDYKPEDLCFNCCKTAYRPYDLTVTAVLIALKHHFPICRIRTDGEEKDWLDGRILCNNLLGYGMDTEIGAD